jgi:hypothetical protein
VPVFPCSALCGISQMHFVLFYIKHPFVSGQEFLCERIIVKWLQITMNNKIAHLFIYLQSIIIYKMDQKSLINNLIHIKVKMYQCTK